MQPAIATDAPVVGVALTAQTTVPGCATGVTNAVDADVAMRFCIEVAKVYGQGALKFYDKRNGPRCNSAMARWRTCRRWGTRPIERFGAAAVR